MFNDFLDNKKNPFFCYKKFISPKNRISPKGLTHNFGQKCNFFLRFVSVIITLEIMFDNVLGRKETFFAHKKFQSFKVPKIVFFPQGSTHAFGQKM